ncbi:hypothetical protein BN1723_001320 [Verticillium longisporum]|uniref:Uncharacterized protein n=1 Tax=Verticillium longisporum TaxID=100787 RepID=A0A0G4NNL6_VERLO|nr:hypothetical protein BN1723_001320 [Verticillium longisporum]
MAATLPSQDDLIQNPSLSLHESSVEMAPPTAGPTGEDASPENPKEPPPEKASDVRRRSFVILSFWAIALCFGESSVRHAMGLLNELKAWKKRRRERAEAEAKKKAQ